MVLTSVNYYYCALTVFAYTNNIDLILAKVVYAYRKYCHYTIYYYAYYYKLYIITTIIIY